MGVMMFDDLSAPANTRVNGGPCFDDLQTHPASLVLLYLPSTRM